MTLTPMLIASLSLLSPLPVADTNICTCLSTAFSTYVLSGLEPMTSTLNLLTNCGTPIDDIDAVLEYLGAYYPYWLGVLSIKPGIRKPPLRQIINIPSRISTIRSGSTYAVCSCSRTPYIPFRGVLRVTPWLSLQHCSQSAPVIRWCSSSPFCYSSSNICNFSLEQLMLVGLSG